MIVYGISNCDSIRKARKWLDKRGVEYHFFDFKANVLTEQLVHSWLQQVSWSDLLNKRSSTWRRLSSVDKTDLNESKAVGLMIQHPTLIKRPVAVIGSLVVVGFDEISYQGFCQTN